MAASRFKTTNHSSSSLTESAGLVLLNRAPFNPENRNKSDTLQCGLIRHNDELLLPKGRRSMGESRADAALRETREETGFACELLPLDLSTRQTREGDAVDVVDAAREVQGVREEAFMVSVREVGEGRVKFIWWFVGFVVAGDEGGQGEYGTEWFDLWEVASKATFESDREVLREAVEIVGRTVRRHITCDVYHT